MKTVVFLVTQLINSGPENVVYSICGKIDRKKYCPIVFSLKNEDATRSIEAKFGAIGVDIYHFGASTLDLELRPGKIAKQIKEKLIELDCDILHVHCYHPNLVGTFINDVKKVTTVHQISGEDFVMKKGILMGNYMKFRFDRTLKAFDKVVVLSEYMKDYYKPYSNKLIKISNGVSRANITLDEESFKRNIGLSGSTPVVLVTGTLSDRKNVTYLLSELKSSNLSFNCFVLGNGDKFEECVKIVGGDPRFHMEGFKNNVWDYLNVSDIYISASKSEGLPMSVLEALNAGVPCLISNIPPHSEIVNDMGLKEVMLFDLKDGSLKENFERMVCAEKNHQQIEEKAKELYSSSTMTSLYENLYDEL